MEIERVQCLLRLNQGGNTSLMTIVKTGPDSLPVTEIPILRLINDLSQGDDDCSLSRVRVSSILETTKGNELARLKQKYGSARVDHCYPGGRALPLTLEDCELPSTALAKRNLLSAEEGARRIAQLAENERAEEEALAAAQKKAG